jgi:glutamyl-tRNA synthetase
MAKPIPTGKERTRLAPSPTGALHLGNARTFLINWLLARKNGWTIQLRIEDLDGPRIKSGADQLALDDLRWLGIDWDEGPIYQSARRSKYDAAIDFLVEHHRAYPCVCTRREVDLAASAPHAEDGASVYPGTCRGKFATIEDAINSAGRQPALRFAVPDETVEFDDAFHGRCAFNVAKQLGDFVIRKADFTPAYQLSVVVDDADAGITQIVRGNDLLDSTPRQILIYRALGFGDRIPHYTHLPLVIGEDGRRLAKRHGDTRLATYRDGGVRPGRILALLARWCGLSAGASPRDEIDTPWDLLSDFDLARIPKELIVFSQADDRWLRS